MGDILHFRRNPDPDQERDRDRDQARNRQAPAPLWRNVLGPRLRQTREEQGERLVDVAEKAGISPQYLSEIERGRKEPSSEMIAAVTGALGLDLADLLIGVASDVRQSRPAGPVLMAA